MQLKRWRAQIHTTVQTNGQISDLSVQHHGRVIRSLQEQLVKTRRKKEERKGYLTRNKRTRLFEKEPGNLMDNGDRNRKVKDNSEDKIRYITSRRLQILKTRFVTLQATSKIEDYKSYKTQRTRHHEKQGSKEERGHG